MNRDANYELDAEQGRRDRVIIAAAIAALFGRTAVTRRIRVVPDESEGTWMREGRLAVQTSHRMAAPLARLTAGRRTGNV